MKNLIFSIAFMCITPMVMAQDILMQNGTFNQCSGSFFDSGGAGPYSNNENFVLTICDDGSGGILQLDFLSFTSETPNDVLTIYDGADTTAPVIGDYSGTNSPGIVRPSPSNPSGCLTFEWVSNEFFSSTGWEAVISCCQLITSTFDGSTPAAVGGIIDADVDEVITFNASVVFEGSDVGATYTWDFGDGTTAMGLTAMHSYPSPAMYPVSFVATDAMGCASQDRIELIANVQFDTTIGNPFVDAGPDVELDCSIGEACTDLTADFLEIGETNTYAVIPIPFDPPFLFSGLSNSLNPDIDDAWSGVEALPFDFCFFGGAETLFQVGSNGVIRFDVDGSDTGNGWAFTENLPNNSNPTLGEANIFTPGHDIDPSVSDSEEIGYEVLGVAPNRVLVVSYYEVPMFSGTCNDLLATQMAVLYETTNIIDIYILSKPSCPTWNSGNAVVGIQNDAGTEAFVPPGRNTSDSPWTTEFEAWRFIPRGPSVTTITWLDESGTVIGDTPTINVCPAGTETYTARVEYLNCNGEVIRVEDTVTVSSNATFSFDLGPNIDTCDIDPITLDAEAGGDVTYQWFLDGVAIPDATDPTYDATTSGTYSCEVTDGECFVQDTIVITFYEDPVANTPADFIVCDDDNDGFAQFTLTDADASIIAGQPDTFVNYYLTVDDAITGDTTLALSSPYTNVTNPQTIYARIENLGGCFDTVSFTLTVNNSPVLNDPIAIYELCDDDTPDGSTTFDLTSWIPEVTDETTSTCLFYATEADANAGTDPIGSPDSYVNTANPELVWVRCDNDLGCFTVGSFELNVNENPEVNVPETYKLCDQLPFDGFTEFDLPSRDDEISGGAAGVSVTYHETIADAQTGTLALSSPYTNTMNPQTVYARVENDVTGCFSIQDLELLVVDTPEAFTPEPLEVCDDDSDGFAAFTLTDADAEITGGAAGVVVSYHETLDDANNNVGALSSPYTNTVSGTQTIYARVTNPVAGECFTVVEVILIVNPLPAIEEPDALTGCDDNADGFLTFDLTTRATQILNGLSPTDFTIQYFEDSAMTVLIGDPTNYTNTTNPQTIYVWVTNVETGCSSQTILILQVFANPVINDPAPYELCDDNNPGDGIEAFDLISRDLEITGGAAGLQVTYHINAADADSGAAALVSPYENVMNPQTVYVRAEDEATGCFSTTTLDLIVLSVPTATQPQDVTICGDSSGTASFDLSVIAAEAANGQTGVTVSFYESESDANTGDNALSSPYTNSDNPQTLFIRVQDDATGCFSLTSVVLRVEFAPLGVAVDTQAVCADASLPGVSAIFDLTIYAQAIGADIEQYNVSYHNSQDDAQANVNAIANPSSYTNSSDSESIYIRVATENGCFSVSEVGISVVACEVVIPQGISPNGDGFNDTFHITGIELHPNYMLNIFDRRGLLVYSGNGSSQEWDGRAIEQSGSLLPVGTYFYTLQLNDNPDSPSANMQQLYSGYVYLNY